MTKYGGDMQSMESATGRVRLHVDHEEVSYYIEADPLCLLAEWNEICEYIYEHGFEILDEDECPPDLVEDEDGVVRAVRFWLCHKDGEEFTG